MNIRREILKEILEPTDWVIDVQCGLGLLLEDMPEDWEGKYYGIDTDAEKIKIAHQTYPGRMFSVDAPESLPHIPRHYFDWAIVGFVEISPQAKDELTRVAKKILYMARAEDELVKKSYEPAERILTEIPLDTANKDVTPKSMTTEILGKDQLRERDKKQPRRGSGRGWIPGKPSGRPPHKR